MKKRQTGVINISKDIKLPIDFLMRHGVVIGESGSGKSYGVGVLCEELSKNGIPFIVLDTQGANLGLLKLAYTYLVNPLNRKITPEKAGKIVANTNVNVVVKNPPAMNLGLYLAYCNRFLKQYVKREQKALRLLIVDEAHLHAPRSTKTPDSEILVNIATSFRSEGLFLYSVTQRIVELNTTIVNQSPNKLIFRLTGYNDAMRLLDILKLKLSKQEADALIREVQNLPNGECLILSNIDVKGGKKK